MIRELEPQPLPTGWTNAVLGDFVYLAGRIGWRGLKAEEYTSSGPLFVSVHSLNHGEYVNFSVANHISRERYDESPEIQLRSDDILLTKDGAGIGKAAIVPPVNLPATINSSLLLIRPSSAFAPKFLYYLLRGPAMQELVQSRITGSTTPHLFQKDIKLFKVPVPPTAEQRRIVSKVEELLARVNAARERLAKVPAILKRFRQSVLAVACSGQLTADWRDANQADSDWRSIALRDAGVISGGITKNGSRVSLPLQVPYLRVANVYENRLELAEIFSIGVSSAELSRTELAANDLLFVEGNGSVDQIGRVAMWDGSVKRCVHQNHLIRFRAGSDVLPRFVLYAMMAPAGREQLVDLAVSSAGLHSLSISKVGSVNLELPTRAEQAEIIHRVDALFSLADKIEVRAKSATVQVEGLGQSILAKAFRGELVRTEAELAELEGRDYEPASVLLERIRGERADPAAKSAPPRRRRVTVKAQTTDSTTAARPVDRQKTEIAKVAKQICLLLDAWGKSVSINALEPALLLFREPDLVMRIPRRARASPKRRRPAAQGVRGLDLLYNWLVSSKVIEPMGRHAYRLIDRSRINLAKPAERKRAAAAIAALEGMMKKRDWNYADARQAIASTLESPYELPAVR